MTWVVSPAVLAGVLVVIALVVLVPSGTATLIAVHNRNASGVVRAGTCLFRVLSYALSALVLVALGLFLLLNHVRVENVILT